MKKINFVLITLAVLIFSPFSNASSRSNDRIGLGLGFLTEPVPSVLGYNLSYNLTNRIRLTGGYAKISSSGISIKTMGLNGKFFLTDTNLAPFAEVGFSSVTGTITTANTPSGFSGTGTALTAGGGFDWQTNAGFNIGLNGKMILKGTNPFVPGFYFGWYF